MRARHVVIAALILIGVGVKAFSFATMTAESETRAQSSVNASLAQQNLPVEGFQDMTFVFPARPGSD